MLHFNRCRYIQFWLSVGAPEIFIFSLSPKIPSRIILSSFTMKMNNAREFRFDFLSAALSLIRLFALIFSLLALSLSLTVFLLSLPFRGAFSFFLQFVIISLSFNLLINADSFSLHSFRSLALVNFETNYIWQRFTMHFIHAQSKLFVSNHDSIVNGNKFITFFVVLSQICKDHFVCRFSIATSFSPVFCSVYNFYFHYYSNNNNNQEEKNLKRKLYHMDMSISYISFIHRHNLMYLYLYGGVCGVCIIFFFFSFIIIWHEANIEHILFFECVRTSSIRYEYDFKLFDLYLFYRPIIIYWYFSGNFSIDSNNNNTNKLVYPMYSDRCISPL